MKRWEKINLLGFFIAFISFLGPLTIDYNVLHNRDGYGPLTFYIAIPMLIIGMALFTITHLRHRFEA